MSWRADIALFPYALATVPETRAVSWATLIRSLTTFRPAVEPERLPQWGRLSEENRAKLLAKPKLANPMWAPVQLAEGARRRLDSNVEAFSCLVLDFDAGLPVEEARAPWMNYPHVVHSSYSHTAEVPKYRVVIPLARPVPASTWPRVWHWASRLANEQNDGQCKNPSRGYFVPVERGPHFSIVHDLADMLLVDPARLPPAPSEIKKPPPAPPKAGSQRPRIHGVDRQIEWALRNDPSARAAVARTLGATFHHNTPQSAKGMVCPKCGDKTAWFFVDIATMRSARCAHKTCGWYGSLTMLLNGETGHE